MAVLMSDDTTGWLTASAVAAIQEDPRLTAIATVAVPDGWRAAIDGSTAVLLPVSWADTGFVPNVVVAVGPSADLNDGDIAGAVLATIESEDLGARRSERSVVAHDLGIPIVQHSLTIEDHRGAVMSVVSSVGTFDWQRVRSLYAAVVDSASLRVESSEEGAS